MKRLLLALGLVFMASTFVSAQMGDGPGKGGPGNPEMRGKMMKERIYKQLEITEEQAKKLDAIEEESNAKLSEIKKNSKILLAELENLLETKASDEKLTGKVDQIQKSARAASEAIHERMEKSRTVLDAKQQAKAVMMLGKMVDMGAMWKGMGGDRREGWGGQEQAKPMDKKKPAKKPKKTEENE